MDYKGNNFLDLINDNNLLTRFTYIKDSTWLKNFGHSNTLCIQATKAITNYIPIGKYYLRFFPRKLFECLCRVYPIKSKHHILHNYKRYNKYWNPNKESLKNFISFLKFNLEAFFFYEEIT